MYHIIGRMLDGERLSLRMFDGEFLVFVGGFCTFTSMFSFSDYQLHLSLVLLISLFGLYMLCKHCLGWSRRNMTNCSDFKGHGSYCMSY